MFLSLQPSLLALTAFPPPCLRCRCLQYLGLWCLNAKITLSNIFENFNFLHSTLAVLKQVLAFEVVILSLRNFIMKTIIGIDLFAGAGGLSLGAERSGIDVLYAIEKDVNAAKTYALNHPRTQVIHDDIKNIQSLPLNSGKDNQLILFGGPPCQGFSTSNQKTRSRTNPQNWLFYEFIRFVETLQPDWIIIENVKGIVETESGLFSKLLCQGFDRLGYSCSVHLLCASDFGIPQNRNRFFLIASRKSVPIDFESYKQSPKLAFMMPLPICHLSQMGRIGILCPINAYLKAYMLQS